METVRLATMAMATRFELVVRGERDAVWLRAIGEEALAEIRRLEARLSFYSPASEISRINRSAHTEPVRVDPGLFDLLQQCRVIHQATGGAFDVTVGPLMHLWGFTGDRGAVPTEAELRDTLARVGMGHVLLKESDRTVAFDGEGIRIDLGGVGKGYAIDEAMRILEEAGVQHAFLHGGTSSMKAMGDSAESSSWTVAVAAGVGTRDEDTQDDIVALVELDGSALAVSDVRGKWFETEDGQAGHVLDPRTGRPVCGATLSAVKAGSAAECDALATAMLVATDEEASAIRQAFPGARFLVAGGDGRHSNILRYNDFADGRQDEWARDD